MSTTPEHHRLARHFVQWSLIIVALLLFHLLSIPWIPPPTVSHPILFRFYEAYVISAGWAYRTPLRPLLEKYNGWVGHVLGLEEGF